MQLGTLKMICELTVFFFLFFVAGNSGSIKTNKVTIPIAIAVYIHHSGVPPEFIVENLN